LVGIAIALERPRAELKLAGLFAAVGGYYLLLTAIATRTALHRLVVWLTAGLLVAQPAFVALLLPQARLDRFPQPLRQVVSSLAEQLQPARDVVTDVDDITERIWLHPSGVGMLAGLGSALGLGLLLAGPGRRHRALGAATLLLSLGGAVLSTNRTAIVAALLSATLLALLGGYWRVTVLLLMVLFTGASLVWLRASGETVGILTSSAVDPVPVMIRLEYWERTLYLLGDYVFTGVGFGADSARLVIKHYFLTADTEEPDGFLWQWLDFRFPHSHNIYLQSYLEQGLLGFVGLLLFTLVAAWIGIRALRCAREGALRGSVVGLLGGITAMVLAGLTSKAPLTTFGLVFLFGLAGALAAADRLITRPSFSDSGWRSNRGRLPLMPATAVACAVLTVGLVMTRGEPAGALNPARWLAGVSLNVGALETLRLAKSGSIPRDEWQARREVARPWLERAAALTPDAPAPYLQLAALESRERDDSKFKAYTAAALDRTGADDANTLFQVGRLHRQHGDVLPTLSAWSRIDPEWGRWTGLGPRGQLVVWGDELAQIQRWPAAIDVNRAAIEIAPAAASPYQDLALGLTRRQGEAAALVGMQALASRYPDIPWPRREAADLLERMGRIDEANEWHKQADEVDRSPAWRALRRAAGPRGG
jgi:tetratricopeptide (TPR) repeat protein